MCSKLINATSCFKKGFSNKGGGEGGYTEARLRWVAFSASQVYKRPLTNLKNGLHIGCIFEKLPFSQNFSSARLWFTYRSPNCTSELQITWQNVLNKASLGKIGLQMGSIFASPQVYTWVVSKSPAAHLYPPGG